MRRTPITRRSDINLCMRSWSAGSGIGVEGWGFVAAEIAEMSEQYDKNGFDVWPVNKCQRYVGHDVAHLIHQALGL